MKIVYILLSTIIFFAGGYAAKANADEEFFEINEKLDLIKKSINEGDANSIVNILSTNASPELKSDLIQKFSGNPIEYNHNIRPLTRGEDDGGTVKARGVLSAKGDGWSVENFPVYFTFERQGGEWRLLDTNVHKRVDGGIFPLIAVAIWALVMLLVVIGGAFWLWMLIDAVRRDFDQENAKIIWLLVIILAGFIGAAVYFFVVKISKKAGTTQENLNETGRAGGGPLHAQEREKLSGASDGAPSEKNNL